MPTAREKLEEVLRGMRQREEQLAAAVSLWKKALPRCQQIADALAEVVRSHGILVKVETREDRLFLSFLDRDHAPLEGATATFLFDSTSRCIEGWRTPFHPVGHTKTRSHFFSLSVPVWATATPASSPFGPQGSAQVSLGPGTQEAFEKAIVDFFEWALVREGAGNSPARQA